MTGWTDLRHGIRMAAKNPAFTCAAVAVLGLGTHTTLHRNNALKNVLAGIVNGVAAIVFVLVADPDWTIVALIAVGSIIGAQIGARAGRRMHAVILRLFIILVGLVALAVFLLR